ncbi:MAG: hypothetical protein ABUL72_01870, partial [Armatimonadota bacterium]
TESIPLLEASWPWLSELLDWRSMAQDQPCSLGGWVGRLRSLAAILVGSEGCAAAHTVERDGRAQNVMQRSLSDLAATRPDDEQMTLKSFVGLATRVWATQNVTVDDRKGGVWVGHSALTVPPMKVVITVGMLEGAMPKRRAQDPVLGDSLRSAIDLLSGGKPKLLSSQDVADSERDEFLRICATASERLIFSFPEAEGESDSAASYYLRALATLIGKQFDQLVKVYPRSKWFPDLADCRAIQDHQMASAQNNPPFEFLPPDLKEPEIRQLLKLDPDAGTPLRQVADYSDCPFRATVRHRLSLFSNRPVSPVHRLVDLPSKASVQLAMTETDARKRLHKALEEKVNGLYSQLEPWEAHLLRAAGERMIDAWIKREFLARQAWPRQEWVVDGFPVHQIRLGEGGTRDEVALGGGQNVKVTTDPMPVYQVGPFLVARLDESSLQDPGKKAGEEGERAYENSSKWLRHGLLISCLAKASEGVALEIETLGEKRWILYFGIEDERQQPGRRVNVLERHDFGGRSSSYRKEVYERTKDVLKEMLAGRIDARPGPACTTCDYGAFCRRSSAILGEESE